ncbi:MAG: HD domain-containing protein [Tissierellia bacterium]|nr:HD domain-containing protein [Tissierellia bacterium]
MKLNLPIYIEEVLRKIEEKGYEAFVVGGCVRDLILGKEPNDYDIATRAQPEDIEDIFKDYKTIDIGKEFGTIVLVLEEGDVEITTYRIEEDYYDGRKPSHVTFSSNIEDDLSRRDFTINSMAYNDQRGLVDPFNGREDLRKAIIKTVGNPYERFKEDHLRILRGVRFASQLGFKLEEKTYKACREMSNLLSKISAERIREELFKILISDKPSYGIRLMEELNILDVIIPELKDTIGFDQHNPHHDKDVFNHTLCVLDNVPKLLELRLAALFHDIGKPHTLSIDDKGVGHFYGHEKVSVKIAKNILTRLKCSKELTESVLLLIGEHMTKSRNMKDRGLKRLIGRVGQERIFQLMDLQIADRMCTNSQADVDFLNERKKEIQRILNKQEPFEKKHLKIDGYDIISLGYKEGKLIGEILDYLLEKVIEDPQLNHKEKLIELVLKKFKLD